jgi:ribose-phosphate pyrophosphokinase
METKKKIPPEQNGHSRNGLKIASCRSGTYLAEQVAKKYALLCNDKEDQRFLKNIDFQFPDSETCVRLGEDVSGCDIFLFQGLFDPAEGKNIDRNYMALLIAARTFREWGSNKVIAVLPYLAYARQDKPTWSRREPTTARIMADLCITAGIGRLVTWHPHCRQVHGFYGTMTVDSLDYFSYFVKEFGRFRERDDVIAVAPDAGASKFVTEFGKELNLKCGLAVKYRPVPGEAQVSDIIGDFSGKRTALILDDMIDSGGTVYELVKKLVTEKKITDIHLGFSHNLCSDKAGERLLELRERYHLQEVIVTDSIPQTPEFLNLPFLTVRSLVDELADAIARIRSNKRVADDASRVQWNTA